MQLRDYQEAFIQNIRASFFAGNRSVIGVMPTGSGKTVCFSNLAMRVANKGKRIAILTHREELLDQVCSTLSDFNVAHNVIAAGRYTRHHEPATVASVFTLARRLDKTPRPDMVIIDEAHHAVGKSTWGKVMQAWRGSLLLGVTATPTRLSGEGMNELFQDMVLGPSMSELIELGHLSDYALYAPSKINTDGIRRRGGDFAKKELAGAADKRVITGSAITHYKRFADGMPAVAFCVSIEHAHHVAEDFKAAGYRAMALDGKMDKGLRRMAVEDFKRGQLQIITSCDLISEGFDCPGIVAGILLRPTQSLGLYLQQVGRCLRTTQGKEKAIILDHAGNSQMHGLPDEDHGWTLDGMKSTQKDVVKTKTCPLCFFVMPPHRSTCPDCGHEFKVENAREVEQVDGELGEMSEAEIKAKRRERMREQSDAMTLDDLIELGKKRGYKDPVGWAGHVYTARLSKQMRTRNRSAA